MLTLTLDGKKMTTIEETHKYLKNALSLSPHYGENLDALWDELSTKSYPMSIRIVHTDDMEVMLGAYAVKLKELFIEISMYNKAIVVRFDDDEDDDEDEDENEDH